MEHKQIPSNKKLISIQEEKLIREVNYDTVAENSTHQPKKLLLGTFEIIVCVYVYSLSSFLWGLFITQGDKF